MGVWLNKGQIPRICRLADEGTDRATGVSNEDLRVRIPMCRARDFLELIAARRWASSDQIPRFSYG